MVRFASLLLTLGLLVVPAGWAGADDEAAVAIANGAFERTREPGDGAYACCFEDWLFASRIGAWTCTAERGEGNSTVARVAAEGEGGRADLLGPFLVLPPFTEYRVRVSVRRQGAAAWVALHPPFARRFVDLRWIDVPEDTWTRFETTLRTGAESEHYRFTLAVTGQGAVSFDDLQIETVRTIGAAEGTVLILDLNDRTPDYEPSPAFWMRREIHHLFGYETRILAYTDFDEREMRRLRPRAVLLTPLASRSPPKVDPIVKQRARADLWRWLRSTRTPVLGICLGHQFLGQSTRGRMKREAESGDVWIERLQPDPLFDGLPERYPCSQSHRYALVDVPKSFELLASSPTCRLQVIRKKGRLQYGSQGHFERGWIGTTPHGRILLGNFFRLVENEGRR